MGRIELRFYIGDKIQVLYSEFIPNTGDFVLLEDTIYIIKTRFWSFTDNGYDKHPFVAFVIREQEENNKNPILF